MRISFTDDVRSNVERPCERNVKIDAAYPEARSIDWAFSSTLGPDCAFLSNAHHDHGTVVLSTSTPATYDRSRVSPGATTTGRDTSWRGETWVYALGQTAMWGVRVVRR